MNPIVIRGLSALEDAATELISQIGESKIVALYGEMGAGKTTLVREICRQLGVKEQVCSPTFAIINVYQSSQNRPIYHFDFYRIKSVDEAYDFGYEEYFFSGELCLIEWPELIEELLPQDTLRLKITALDEHNRVVEAL